MAYIVKTTGRCGPIQNVYTPDSENSMKMRKTSTLQNTSETQVKGNPVLAVKFALLRDRYSSCFSGSFGSGFSMGFRGSI